MDNSKVPHKNANVRYTYRLPDDPQVIYKTPAPVHRGNVQFNPVNTNLNKELDQLRGLSLIARAILPYRESCHEAYNKIKESALCEVLCDGWWDDKRCVIDDLIKDGNNQELSETIRLRYSILLELLGVKIAGIITNPNELPLLFKFNSADLHSQVADNLYKLQLVKQMSIARKAELYHRYDVNCFEIVQLITESVCEEICGPRSTFKIVACRWLIISSQNQQLHIALRKYLKEKIQDLNSKYAFCDLECDDLRLDFAVLQKFKLNLNIITTPISYNEQRSFLKKLAKLPAFNQAISPYREVSDEYIRIKETAIWLTIHNGIVEEKSKLIFSLIEEDMNIYLPRKLRERCSILLQILQVKIGNKVVEVPNFSLIPEFSHSEFLYAEVNRITNKLQDARNWNLAGGEFTANLNDCFEITECFASKLRNLIEQNDSILKVKAVLLLIITGQNTGLLPTVRNHLKQVIYELNRKFMFVGLNLSGLDLSGLILRALNLSNSNLRNAKLNKIDFRGANLSGSDLRGATLSGSNLSAMNLNSVNLTGVNLSSLNMRYSTFLDADLSYTNLTGTDFVGSIFCNTLMHRANKINTKLEATIDLIN